MNKINRIVCLLHCKSGKSAQTKEFTEARTGLDEVIHVVFRASRYEEHLYFRLGDYFERIDVADGALYDSLVLVFWPLQNAKNFWKDLIVKTLRDIREKTGASIKILRQDQQP